jgi:hypothetical protein
LNFVYCDAALISNQGHFATQCRSVTAALRRRGMTPHVLAHSRIDPALAAELGAQPHFSIHPNMVFSSDPLCGWLISFASAADITGRDLEKIVGIGPGDFLFYDSAKPAQLMAVVDWAQRNFNPSTCPQIIVTFNWFPGVVTVTGEGGARQWSISDVQSVLYRFAGLKIANTFASRFRFASLDAATAEAYSFLTGRQVGVLPSPFGAVTSQRNRRGASPVRIAFLGEQRVNKGVQVIPAVARGLLAADPSIRVLVHNSWIGPQPEMDELREIASRDKRLELRIEAVEGAAWAALLDAVDLIVLPYDQVSYSNCNSGIAWEAIANAVPLVVPQGTGMARMLDQFGSPGVTFERVAPDLIVQAVLAAVGEFDELATRAAASSRKWAEANGGDKVVEALLVTA